MGFHIGPRIRLSIFPIVCAIIQTEFPKDAVSIGQRTLVSMFLKKYLVYSWGSGEYSF